MGVVELVAVAAMAAVTAESLDILRVWAAESVALWVVEFIYLVAV